MTPVKIARTGRLKVVLTAMASRSPPRPNEDHSFTTFPPEHASDFFRSPRMPAVSTHFQPHQNESRMTSRHESHVPSTYGSPTHQCAYGPPMHPTAYGLPTQGTHWQSLSRPIRRQNFPQAWTPYPIVPHFGTYDGMHQQTYSSGWRGQAPPQRRHTPLRPNVIVNREMHTPDSFKISVLCYNLLAQDLIYKNPSLYSERDPNHLDWEFRKGNLLSELSQNSADIFCLQEVQEDAYVSWFSPQLTKKGYSGLYKRRTGEHSDGCALFYKCDRLQLLEHKMLEFQKDFKILDRDNVGIIAKFAPNSTEISPPKSSFCVATTHILYNPRAGEVKLAQLAYLLAELHQMASTEGEKELLPVILCGDFNSLPTSHLYKFITSAFLDYSNMSAAEVAGYHRRKRGQHRVIPHPLLPSSMSIGNGCVYKNNPTSQQTAGVTQGRPMTEQSTTKCDSADVTVERSVLSESADLPARDSGLRSGGEHAEYTNHVMKSSEAPKCVLTHPFSFSSAYPHSPIPSSKSTVTTFHQSAFETVDYIFYSPVSKSRGFYQLSRKALPSTHVILGLGPQPHDCLSSDHLFLCAVFQLVFKS